ncbi:hypothetical protein KIW84_022442 [Lathyrus oleraceus]|uniref:Uncharacterized protein n=1 Tax=Pisum sativum TaxID=3888 RepID=A0A9D5B9Z0_PEA|nr:hypothetical protein KIW84_022440 [Pisum sativum]KAI5436010.1 hypothetical protein KIW84_022442 [Pisum sativum]
MAMARLMVSQHLCATNVEALRHWNKGLATDLELLIFDFDLQHGRFWKLKIKWLQGNKTGCLNQPRHRGHLSEMKHFGLVVHTTENENKSSSLPLSRLMRWWIHSCKSYEEFWTLSDPVHKLATTNLPRLETANTYHTKPYNKTGGNRNFKSGGRIEDAVGILTTMPCPNSSSWNSIITGFVNRNRVSEASL